MKNFLPILLMLATCFGVAQDQGEFKKPTSKVVKASSAPVTRAEARKVLDRAWTVLAKGLKLTANSPLQLVADGSVVTKNEVLQEFNLVVQTAAKHFKRNPRPASFDASRLRTDGDSAQMKFLVTKGLVMPLGPLVTGKNGPLSTLEFGDAVGVLVARLSDLCHLPSSQFSPNLMPG